MTLSLCCVSGGEPGRLAELLRVCRPFVDEIVVALDDRVDAQRTAEVAELADDLTFVPFAAPVERVLPWLFNRCSSEWVLRLDDDEVPSPDLLDGLRTYADGTVTHVWFPRRWLFPDRRSYLASHPWVPDFQLRLSLNDPRLVRFPGIVHVPIEVAGPGRYVDAPLYHLDTLRPRAERVRKAEVYERLRPGLRGGRLAFNHQAYLPELSDPTLASVPAADLRLIEQVAAAPAAARASSPAIPTASREEIDALWPLAAHEPSATLELRAEPPEPTAGSMLQVQLSIANTGSATLSSPSVQVGSRWDGDHAEWSFLPRPIPPGATDIASAVTTAPDTPGPHELELQLVREGIGWFGATIQVRVDVIAPIRVGVLVRNGDRESATDLARTIVLRDPRVEPVMIGVSEAGGYRTAPGHLPELSRGLVPGRARWRSLITAARRARALRQQEGLELSALVLADLEPATLVERLADFALAAQASARGVAVFVPVPGQDRGLLDRLLLRRLLSLPGVVAVAGDPLDAVTELSPPTE